LCPDGGCSASPQNEPKQSQGRQCYITDVELDHSGGDAVGEPRGGGMSMTKGRSLKLVLATAALAAGQLGMTSASAVAVATVAPHPFLAGARFAQARVKPTPTSVCVSAIGIHCYAPQQLATAYNLSALHAHGIDGRGTTIAIVDSFGSPTIAADLHTFDQIFGVSNTYGVPVDPAIAQDPSLTVISPAGAIPPFDQNNPDHVGWAQETTLDVEWAHVFAPRAKLLLVTTPVAETEGVVGFPEIVKAENYVINHGLADVITQSFGATEATFPSPDSLLDLRGAFKNARKHHVTMLGSSGDAGATDFQTNALDLYTHRVNSWPSSDPLVTSIGGTQLTLNDNGTRTAPDMVWNDGFGAGGGGPSAIFKRPGFQSDVKNVTGPARGTPDISLSAAVNGGVWVYYTFVNPDSPFHIFGGTSESSPEFSGIVAMTDQVAGHRLGLINNRLYEMRHGIVDITVGNNTITFTNTDNITYTVVGFDAVPGYDMASGLGTINAPSFVRSLAAADSSRDDNSGDGN
jgi:subtilase family serine protease